MLTPNPQSRYPECRDWTKERLIAFEQEMAKCFERGEIKSPLHLSGGNENSLIAIFQPIRDQDWVLCSWRSHYHCLLKGVPENELRDAIFRGRSIHLSFPAYRVLSSAIVGGICPIAVGLAWSIKAKGLNEKVYCFIGDMTARTGIFAECKQYAFGHDLPVSFIVENNGKSVCTDTREVWGVRGTAHDRGQGYDYELKWPHVGIGKFIQF